MKKNKELKTGDKIWRYAPYVSMSSNYTVKSVKKENTLVSIVAERKNWCGSKEKIKEIKMYGHCSSSMLSGYDNFWNSQKEVYTCDYDLCLENTRTQEAWERENTIGNAVLEIAKQIVNR